MKSLSHSRTTSTRALACVLVGLLSSVLIGCSTTETKPVETAATTDDVTSPSYQIGPGDTLQVFVWRNEEFSVTVPVRPDGNISTPLVEDIRAVGITPSDLGRAIETRLEKYIRNPIVTVIVMDFVGASNQQVKVIGEATRPQAIPFRSGMTLLDVVIAVGGLTEFANGNGAKIVRGTGENAEELPARLEDLVKRGDIGANVRMHPGDIVIIPQSWF